ncbi:MAG: CAP domain-containing protein [bacterium]|nr:CAP domain-containing protein [bacterium]
MKKQTKKISRKPVSKKKKQKNNGVKSVARFLPAFLIALSATILSAQPSAFRPQSVPNQVLSYATNVSISGLLSSTNTQRTNNGVKKLTINSKLNSAAQAKANDMVAKDYWSHVSPDGKQPWWFITNAGYSYTSAGENLAYGFLTSSDTVTGWMNSPSHRSNLLSSGFTEVGFGFANSADYVNDGKQTVVVAMYAKPQASAPVASTTPTKKSSTPKTAPAITTQPSALSPTPAKKAEPKPIEQPKQPEPKEETIALAETSQPTDSPITAAPTQISRIQLLTGGAATWSATAITLIVTSTGVLWLFHKGLHLRRYLVAGEHFITHHVHLDMTVLALVYLGFVMLASSGAVR